MSALDLQKWYHANKYNAESACKHCGGVIRHAYWCVRCNPAVAYAFAAVEEPGHLTLEDQLILHALGVAWV